MTVSIPATFFKTTTKITLGMGIMVSCHIAAASLLYQVVTPDGRTVTVNNPTKAYQLNPDTSKITVIDTNNLPDNNPIPAAIAPNSSPIPAYTTNSTTNADGSSTTTLTVNQPMLAPLPPAKPTTTSEFEEMNISSTKASKKGDYRLTVLTPMPEQLYRRPAQDIEITLAIAPKLKKGDTVNISIDDQVVKNGTDLSYKIPIIDINPDQHTLLVQIVNVLNQPIASISTKFFVVQNNPLIQKQRQLKKQLAAYEALPWYEKLKLRLGFEDKTIDTSTALNPSAKK